MNTSVTSAPVARVAASKLVWAAPLAGLVAVIINAVLFLVGDSMGLFPATALVQGQPLTIVPVLISSFAPVLVAGLVYALIGRFARNPWRVFSILAAVLLVLSFVNPFMGIPGITMPMAMLLDAMHVVVAGSVLYFFRKYATVETAI